MTLVNCLEMKNHHYAPKQALTCLKSQIASINPNLEYHLMKLAEKRPARVLRKTEQKLQRKKRKKTKTIATCFIQDLGVFTLNLALSKTKTEPHTIILKLISTIQIDNCQRLLFLLLIGSNMWLSSY